MRKSPGVTALLAAAMAAAFLFFAGCAGKGYTAGTAPDSFPCVPESKLEKDIVPEAALESLSCSFKKYEGKETLHITVAVKNVSDKPQRYRVNIFLEDMDKGFGHLVPRKGSPPVLEPGKSETVKIPFIGTDKESKKILVIVKTVSVD